MLKKKTAKAKKMKKTNAPLKLQSLEGTPIKLGKDKMTFLHYEIFRPEIRLVLTTHENLLDTFTPGAPFRKVTRFTTKDEDGSIRIGCQTFDAKTVKAVRTWAEA